MIVRNLFRPKAQAVAQTLTLPELVEAMGFANSSGQAVTAEKAKNIATAYRCINVLGDDLAKMPLQVFTSRGPGQIERVQPSGRTENLAWLLEVSPNRFMTPFIFKKTLMQWLITYGNAYAWTPTLTAGMRREIHILAANTTRPVYDLYGNLWYQAAMPDGKMINIPDVEILHLKINSIDGITGRSVISYARESLGRQIGAYQVQGKFYDNGFTPTTIMQTDGALSADARKKIRDEYIKASSESGVVVLDSKMLKVDMITMKPVDMQFLQSIEATDLEIANFFGVPLYKLNQGKQAYNSNEQQNLDYLSTTLDPYLVQFEQGARLRWLSQAEQDITYLRFNRDALLRTDAKTRADMLNTRIMSGQLTLNEARGIEDQGAEPGGDIRLIPGNMAVIEPDGSVRMLGGSGAGSSGGGANNAK
jgi:HK97 family phage portal protein